MTQTIRVVARAFNVALVLSCVSTAAGSAQGTKGGMATATVALVTSLPPGARLVVQRGQGGRSRNLILLTESATAVDLATGIDVLRSLRARDGEEINDARRLTIGSIDQNRALRPALRQDMEQYLNRLRTAAARDIADLGTVRAIVIPLAAVTPRRAG